MLSKKINLNQFPSPGNRYSLQECVGCGAYGKVFASIDTQASNKKVAIKIQKLKENSADFIQQEYKILRDMSGNVNLPDFYGIYRKEDEVWFVMELCEGGPVIDLVRDLSLQNRCMSEEHIAYILKETLKAVTFLHENCTIHRDIKAKNILLTKEGEVKLIDFGFSCTLKNNIDGTNGCLGSPSWMAPEIITSRKSGQNYDNRSDVWSLGITAIELGDGKSPYQSMHPTRAVFQVVTNPPPTLYRPSNWSQDYVDFINECLIKNPEHRPFMAELMDHPFLTQIPDNNYHLTLEIKSLINDVNKMDSPKDEPEIALNETFIKCGYDGDLEEMLVEDLSSLNQISEMNILNLLEARLKSDHFHTFVGDVLLILNPNEKKNIFGPEYHKKYCLKSRSDNEPHVYSVADSAYQYALHHGVPQRILLTGESGSGKTTNYLHLIDHLFYLGHNENINLDRIKGAIKLIHSLTHASTPINDYSTRCVFQTDIKYGRTGKVSGAIFNIYQLERWRISSVDMFQGNYHFLYYIYDGLKENKKLDKYQLDRDCIYRYLRVGENSESTSPKFNLERNLKKFKKILKIFEDFEIGDGEMDTIFSIVAAVLNVGEIRFDQSSSEGAIVEASDNIEKIGQLLQIDPHKFQWSLTNYCLVRKGAVLRRQSTADEARDARDVFANNLYARLVDYIVAVVNHKLTTGRSIFGEKYSIQIFDYFGFECFKENHLPQLFVNCFNEQLHYHYLQRIFSGEYFDANEEELRYQPTSYQDNKTILDHLLSKSIGIFSAIDVSTKTGRDSKYVIDFIETSASKYIRVTRESEFSVAHYCGKVNYNAKEMPDKNRDFLPPEIIETLRLSDNPIIKMFFTNKLNKIGNLLMSFNQNDKINKSRYKFQSEKSSDHQYSQIKRIRTCSHTYKALSLEILKELSTGSGSGGTHFIQCVRSDLKGKPKNFDHQLVKQQIRALAVTETARIRQNGYPQRITFQEFLKRYQFLAFQFDENVEITRNNCRLLLVRLKMEGWNIGKSKVFLRYYNEEYLARLYETQVKKIIKIQSILRRFLGKCSVAKRKKDQEREFISVIGKPKKERMTEEEAAAIIQKAYRESTLKKSYADFAKDYNVLDDETCDFIRPFALKWRRDSFFHVLVLYRAMVLQDSFNFSQQVHFYNIGVVYQLEEISEEVATDLIDQKAQVSNWLGEVKLPVRKIIFKLDEIPFYDTSNMLNPLVNPGVSTEKDDAWDSPYRWKELTSLTTYEYVRDVIKTEESLINVPYTRDPTIPTKQIPDDKENENKEVKVMVEEYVSKEDKKEENEITKEIKNESPNEKLKEDENKFGSGTKLANKDFDYIRHKIANKPKSMDPIAELRQIGRKNESEDEPPFNFQGMLRKTNYKREIVRSNGETEPVVYTLKGRGVKNSDTEDKKNMKNQERIDHSRINGLIEENDFGEKRVKLEIAPGVTIEGIEIEL